jgi:hypothetical protein
MSHYRNCISIEERVGVIHGRAVENCIRNHGEPIVYHPVSYIALYIAITAIVALIVASTVYIVTHRRYVRRAQSVE